MEEFTGRVDDDGERFFADADTGEMEVSLFVTPMQAAQEPQPFDLAPFAGRRVRVTCQVWQEGSAAWGVERLTPLD